MTRSISIGILGTRGIPNRYGGFEECAEQLAVGLVAKGHKVTVYSSDHHAFSGDEWNGVDIIHCKDPEDRLGTAGQFLYDLNCINDARKRRFDIVLHLGYTSSSIWWWRWPKASVNLVNMDGLEWKRSKYNKPVQQFLRIAEKLAAVHADGLIADSPGIRNYLARQYEKSSTYIPYGAKVYEHPDPGILHDFGLQPDGYFLLIARMEPENNIETIIKGVVQANDPRPLIIVGSTDNAYGSHLRASYEGSEKMKFIGAIYDAAIINSLRHYAALYFHGHSVGGTNPSLLEAMACGARIAAHDNIFNRAVLGEDAYYFTDAVDVTRIINDLVTKLQDSDKLLSNLQKINSEFNWPAVVRDYEQLFMENIAEKEQR